jgi:phosphoribosylformylglycinamidine synthase
MFGKPPRTVLEDESKVAIYSPLKYDKSKLINYTEQVLQLESVGCKDWLTNKVDRSVTGKIAKQQCAGKLQLPLNNLGVVAIDYQGLKGISTSLGHAPAAGLIDAANGSILSIAESLTNIIWAPLTHRIKGISLSANWMWPAKNQGENFRLYSGVEAASEFACSLGVNIPTGKDSLSMTQKYKNDVVYAPGTVIISASGEVSDIGKVVEPVLVNDASKPIYYIDFSRSPKSLGGSSLAQILSQLGENTPTVSDPAYFVNAFNTIQDLIDNQIIISGHDISSGGIITTLLEMCFAQNEGGIDADLTGLNEADPVKLLFSENPGIVVQPVDITEFESVLKSNGIGFVKIGYPANNRQITLINGSDKFQFDIDALRDKWFKPSYLLDRRQSGEELALERYHNYKQNELNFDFGQFTGKLSDLGIDQGRRLPSGIKAAIIREKGSNGDREMAWSMYLAGFDVKDVHMTDLISGRETLEDINLIVFVGGFSNSDVLGSAKGWAGAFRSNEKAKTALENFYKRDDTLSLGICNGCQLMVELDLVNPGHTDRVKMAHNESHKFESCFVSVDVLENESVMFRSLSGKSLGAWVAHGEGKFVMPYAKEKYQIPVKFSHSNYPGNPNGSDYDTAAICSEDGRHLAMMPHIERAIYPWQWANYPANRKDDQVTPWIEAFVNAVNWIKK